MPKGEARHPLIVRLTHWVNALAVLLLLMSGAQIFNAHPALYWGEASDFGRPWLEMGAVEAGDGFRGVTQLGSARFDTTGLFGVSGRAGEPRGFPAWATLPSYRDLASGRRWHFFFAWALVLNGAAYVASGLASGRFKRRLTPSLDDLRPNALWTEFRRHLSLAALRHDAGAGYNPLQKLAYLAVIFGLLPAMILTGLSMSPGVNAAWPWLSELFGGRQSARSVHFICAGLIVLFVLAHLAMVIAIGPVRSIRAMTTGGGLENDR